MPARRYLIISLCPARRVTENAFGILCQVFRIFFTPINLKAETVDYLIIAARCIHNYLRNEYLESYPPERHLLLHEEYRLPTQNMIGLQRSGGYTAYDGFQVRNSFKDFFNKEGSVSW